MAGLVPAQPPCRSPASSAPASPAAVRIAGALALAGAAAYLVFGQAAAGRRLGRDGPRSTTGGATCSAAAGGRWSSAAGRDRRPASGRALQPIAALRAPHHRRGGARALEPPGSAASSAATPCRSPRRPTDAPLRCRDRLGARPRRGVEAEGLGVVGGRQPRPGQPDRPPAPGRRRRRARALGGPGRAAAPGDHREPRDGRPAAHDGGAGRAARARRGPLARRLRDGPDVAGIPAQALARRDQDRPLVRARGGQRRGRRGDRALDGRDGAGAAPARGGRGRRGRGRHAPPGASRLRIWSRASSSPPARQPKLTGLARRAETSGPRMRHR